MARNVGHARADDKVNEAKNFSRNTLNYRDLTMKTFQIPLSSLIQCKTQIVHLQSISLKRNP